MLQKREMKAQVLDTLDLERERVSRSSSTPSA